MRSIIQYGILLLTLFQSLAVRAQESADSIQIPAQQAPDQNPGFRNEIYPLIFMLVSIIVLLIFFLMMRQSGKNRRNNYRKTFKN